MTLGEMLHTQALRDPGATALICGDEKISYGELDESSSRLDSALTTGNTMAPCVVIGERAAELLKRG